MQRSWIRKIWYSSRNTVSSAEENRCGNYDLNPACPPESGTVEEMKKHAMKYEKALVLQTMQEYSMDFKKAKVAHNKLTEALAERMKEDGKTDLLLMDSRSL